jgi:hypothetical protein
MYCLLELLTVIGVVVVLAMILFVSSAAVIVVDEAMRSVLGYQSNMYVGSLDPQLQYRRAGM